MLGLKTICVIREEYPGLAPISRKHFRAKDAYYALRHDIRRLRRAHPDHMDVAWFAESLGLKEWNDRPIRRHFDKLGRTILSTTIIAPAHKIP